MSGDYSRNRFKARNNYSGVLMQQGRVQLDADWNEQVDLSLRRQRTETVDTIGRAVVPMQTPDGFKIELNAGELRIFPGRMYVDGLLAENHGAGSLRFDSVLDEERGSNPVLYQNQPFFPNAQSIEPLPTSGMHIAYLDVWQRELTYVKQPDLIEQAVGIDTTARWQTVWQVKVLHLEGVNSLECGDALQAWDELIAPSAGRLTTAIVEAQEEDNVCLVPTEGGYRALENRLYRVEVHDGGDFDSATFKWARHNASIETMVEQINGTELTVTRSQWDAIRRFNQNDWVEITDDVRELSGQPGEMRRISSINYATNEIVLSSALPAADFPTTPTHATLPTRHTRIRRWDHAALADATTGVASIINSGIYLEDGIEITFSLDADPSLSGEFKTGDYWLFYARSNDASIELLNAAPPKGIHHHYARLAVLNFPDDQDDCRPHWPPQWANGCCCTLTVGVGGEYETIQEAVNQLPNEGGKVCVMPGVYREHVRIVGKQNVIISGCGERTRIESDPDNPDVQDRPLITIENSRNIRVEALALLANHRGEGVLIHQALQDPDSTSPSFAVRRIVLSKLLVSAGAASAIRCDTGHQITIEHSLVRMRDEASQWPGVFVIGDEVLIQNNSIFTEADKPAGAAASSPLSIVARGGLQIGGASTQVTIVNNHIQGGVGDGITLGSLQLVDQEQELIMLIMAFPMVMADPCDACSPPSMSIPPVLTIDADGNEVDEPQTVVSAGALYDIVIEHNHIEQMGRNGIGVVGFFDLDEVDEFISINHLQITDNRIENCLNRVLTPIEAEQEDDMGYGGIALADVTNLIIQHNIIENNGRNFLDPICGIYVLHGEGIDISDNRILNNGEKLDDPIGEVKRGARSGIHITYAITPTVDVGFRRDIAFPRQNGVPAARIHNNIVSQPVGRALTLNALGPVSVTHNQFTSRGIIRGQASSIASTIAILNLGMSNEFYLQLLGFSQLAKGSFNAESLAVGVSNNAEGVSLHAREGLDDFRLGRYLANGNVLFAHNQCVLDVLDTEQSIALSAIAILSMDDVGFHSNQCDYNLWGDFLIFPNFIFAPSVRVSDNRFKESLYGALLSGLIFGLMNTTTDNQATHCLLVIGDPKLRINEHNTILADAIVPPVITGNQSLTYCELIKAQMRKMFNLGDRL